MWRIALETVDKWIDVILCDTLTLKIIVMLILIIINAYLIYDQLYKRDYRKTCPLITAFG